MRAGPWGCYVHVPWCAVRCPYCAFYVVPERGRPNALPFVDRVHREVAERPAAFHGRPQTVYLGGGTPSRLPPSALRALLDGLPCVQGGEISAEANPEDIDEEWVNQAVEGGLTRVSLGVQSFQADIARRLGRGHTVAQAREACAAIRDAPLQTWSLDLIFAVPGQTMESLDADLDIALDLEVPHIAVYGLTFEPGTRFERARSRGSLVEVDDDLWRRMYDHIVARLSRAGLDRYELSNFARADHRCRHNLLYWSDAPYLGVGPSAHSYAPDGSRWHNHADLDIWLDQVDPVASREEPDARQRACDLLVSGLRGVDGVDELRLAARTGLAVATDVRGLLVRAGMLEDRGDRLVLTHDGFPLCDAVVSRLLDALEVAALK